ncbi:MAG: DUF4382 domain-containing protein [Dehalococcoidia bacterium]|nr:MAG: DUF4382 domain-containing protein [Dehalococcoidia bacterium]
MIKYLSLFMVLVLAAILLPGCTVLTSTPTNSSLENSMEEGMGRLVINITDPPVPLENVKVSFEYLEVHKSGGPWTRIEMENDTFELLDLDGVTELLASQIVEVGIYTQLRLGISTVQIWITGDETPHEARVPSGTIKLVGSFKVLEGGITEITVDINGAQSVQAGNGEYIFRPVVKLLIPDSAKPGEEENGETTETPTPEPSGTVTTAL